MDKRTFLNAVMNAQNIAALEAALSEFLEKNANVAFVPVGGRPNNRGAIEVASDPGRSLIERVTNAHDALLELEHDQHSGVPICKSPREAASAWLGVPEKEGLAGLSNKQRQDLGTKTIVRLEPGEGWQSRLLTVLDSGIGIAPDRLAETILSLNESNKIQKHYLAGTYGQGGSSTFAFCKYAVIVSRYHGSEKMGFTLVRYEELPAEEYKTGRYVYLVQNNVPLEVDAEEGDTSHGTIVRHFGYDLTRYTSALGSKSLYGMLGCVLFDPVASLRFENGVHKWNRTIKGARNALNGALDEGDDDTKGPNLDHHVPMFSVNLGDYGNIGIEYWVLTRPELKEGKKKQRTKPSENFVDSGRPIILTHNGQNQGDITGRLIKDESDLPYLQTQGRLICHINCDRLTPTAKRMLFASTREKSREGYMLERIRTELIGALKADDELVRLNEEARKQSLKENDEDAEKKMRQQVAKLLRLVGNTQENTGTSKGQEGTSGELKESSPPKPKPLPITPCDPPTYIKIIWNEEKEVPFYASQRRYIRLETDANSDYHNSDDPAKSRINIAVGNDLKVFGTSPLKGGRMRVGIECLSGVTLKSTGSIRVELYRSGLPALSDEREYRITDLPEVKEQERKSVLPEFKIIPVSGPEDNEWEQIAGDSEDVKKHASNAIMSSGILHIYYSEAFPRFANELKRFELQGEAVSNSFRSRYGTWLAVHALLMQQDMEDQPMEGVEEAVRDEILRQERCRHANIAAMMASQEVQSGAFEEEEEAYEEAA